MTNRHHRILIKEDDNALADDGDKTYILIDVSCADHEPTDTDLKNAWPMFETNILNGTLVNDQLNFEGDNGAGVYLYFTLELKVLGGLTQPRRNAICALYNYNWVEHG